MILVPLFQNWHVIFPILAYSRIYKNEVLVQMYELVYEL